MISFTTSGNSLVLFRREYSQAKQGFNITKEDFICSLFVKYRETDQNTGQKGCHNHRLHLEVYSHKTQVRMLKTIEPTDFQNSTYVVSYPKRMVKGRKNELT